MSRTMVVALVAVALVVGVLAVTGCPKPKPVDEPPGGMMMNAMPPQPSGDTGVGTEAPPTELPEGATENAEGAAESLEGAPADAAATDAAPADAAPADAPAGDAAATDAPKAE